MRIAQVSPLAESVPPKLYGGTERVVSWLTEELVRQGHEVTLFASGDSRTSARLVPVTARALRLDPAIREPLGYHIMLLEEVRKRAHEFDIVHFHLELLHAPLARSLGVPSVTTLHGRLDLPDLSPFPGAAAGIDLGLPAPAAAPGELGGDDLSRHAAQSAARPPAAIAGRAIPGLPGADIARETARPGD